MEDKVNFSLATSLVFIILSVIGLVNALSGNKRQIPVIGEYVAKWDF